MITRNYVLQLKFNNHFKNELRLGLVEKGELSFFRVILREDVLILHDEAVAITSAMETISVAS